MAADPDRWPKLPYAAWADTAATLQLWTQIVGKIRLALTPWLNHSWHVALYVTTRGLTTSPMPYGARSLQIDFDFVDHVLWLRLSDGQFRQLALKPMSVAEFYAGMMTALKELGIAVKISTMPCEIPNCMAFDQDTVHASYDADAANRFWRVLLAAHDVMARFRTGFLGKTSPVHFFWGSFDLAVTRFSGRTAPPPKGFAAAKVKPGAAFFSKELGEFILPYDTVRTARDPDATLMEFLQSTYAAAADLAKWDRKALECPIGEPGKVRLL